MHFLIRRTVGLVLLSAALSQGACSWFEEDGPPDGFGGGFGTGGGTVDPIPIGGARSLEPLTIAEEPPPPIAGGTLYFSESTNLVLASDPDRDAVFAIDAAASGTAIPLATVALEPGDEPGRIGEAGGRFWVVLRSGGAVAAIDPAGWSVERISVCPTPRGVAGEGGSVHVACASGELVTLDAATGEETRRVALEPDLRDVVVTDEGLYVSRFRHPEVILLDAAGAVVSKTALGALNGFEPSVAYQTIAHPDGGVVVVHQYGNVDQVPFEPEPNAYGQSGCGAINVLGLAHVTGGFANQLQLGAVTLPVSVAMDEVSMVVVDAGSLNDASFTTDFFTDDSAMELPSEPWVAIGSGCEFSPHGFPPPANLEFADGRQVVAAVATPFGTFVQSRDPWQVVGPGLEVSLPGPNPKDTGHDLFHERAGASIACASCHAEGGDDGLVWFFDGSLPRRTHDLRGGILATAPFHWDGARADMNAVMLDAFTTRMSGPLLDASYAGAVAGWTDSVPMPAPPREAIDADVLAGKAIFESAETGCASCHTAPLFTNGETVDVGTGEAFQVPSLVGAAHRVAYLHDGCAPDLETAIRVVPCATDPNHSHGDVSGLSAAELAQLVEYLRSL